MSRTLRVSSFAAFAAAMVLVLGSTSRGAEDKKADDKKAEAKGTISGTVNGVDGKPAKEVTVRLFAQRARGERQQSTQAGPGNGEVFVAAAADKPAADKPAADKPAADGERPAGDRPRGDRAGRGQGQRPQALKETKTNDKGEFTLVDVAAGEYSVAVTEGQNTARERVTVKAGETAKVTLALKAREQGRGNRSRGNQNPPGDAPKGDGAAK
jgi:hypothetical protein